MNYSDYSRQALRTAPVTVQLYAVNDTVHCCLCEDLKMAALGLVGELGEMLFVLFDRRFNPRNVDFDEGSAYVEFGDMMWYLNVASVLLDIEFGSLFVDEERVFVRSVQEVLADLLVQTMLFADTVKKICAQFHLIDKDELRLLLEAIGFALQELCILFDIDMFVVFDRNIFKLRSRYPDGFSAERSMRR